MFLSVLPAGVINDE